MKRRREESGFALLLVFLLAAAIAIGLYIEMPRVAFESQRQREQLLISRGEQYKRAIQLFYRKYHTYPQNLDDLETTKNIRFLRRRYKDPLTGKAEWRLIHVGPGGMLTDSLVTPATGGPSDPNRDSKTADNSQTGAGASGTGPAIDPATGQPINQGLNMAARRPSDRMIGNGPEQPVSDNQDPNQQMAQQPQYPAPGQPQYQGQPVQPQDPGQPGTPVDPSQPGQPQIPGQPGQPTDPSQPVQPQYPGQPGQPQYPGQPVQPQYPGQPQYPQPQYPGQPQYPQPQYPGQPQNPQPQYPGQPVQPAYPLAPPPGVPPGAINPATGQPYNPNQPYLPNQGFGQGRGGYVPQYPGGPQTAPGAAQGQQNQATALIQNILTTARQPPSGLGLGGGGTGLAGVASTAQGTGIHIVNDRKKYKEWEFVYDIKNDKTTGVGQLMQQQQQMMQQGAPGTQGGAFGNQPGQGGPGVAQPPAQPTVRQPNQ